MLAHELQQLRLAKVCAHWNSTGLFNLLLLMLEDASGKKSDWDHRYSKFKCEFSSIPRVLEQIEITNTEAFLNLCDYVRESIESFRDNPWQVRIIGPKQEEYFRRWLIYQEGNGPHPGKPLSRDEIVSDTKWERYNPSTLIQDLWVELRKLPGHAKPIQPNPLPNECSGAISALDVLCSWCETQPPEKEPASKAFYLGDRRYRVDNNPPLILQESEDHVLRSLIELGGAGSKGDIERQSGKSDGPRILKRVREKYPELSQFINLPGKKGNAGYRTSIQRATN